MKSPKIELCHVGKHFRDPNGETRTVLTGVNLEIAAGDFLCLLGPSGCGKTTLLNLMAGFERSTEGELRIDGQLVSGPHPRHITIFQDYGLFPWRTVLDNVTFGLEAKGVGAREAREMAEKQLELVGLRDVAGRFPHQLSGGMKQRVSIARALAVEPDILFMDEPFAALDAFTRFRLQEEILHLWREKGPTIIFVTHDIDEAVYLGRRIAIMSPDPGRITTVLDVELARPCERTSPDFLHSRRKVFQAFRVVHETAPEYAI
ncbi:ATP-binding cassette domain-containing protein [Heliobacterium gestii]|uniref:ATP-binding cassette domain-containing protein n=1 Tax=Heliomicrobium gestii TaxID=2699 RepID=A0A845L4S4_HELGE|nr:ABC transporter ATP-binding protein [Heliomicrobium gestii]MBM7865306.1 NitT/TauT family transport system ATP-binding protein [Heliomicrobium gestii]MZP41567.1 ATP-binding cassette domain-containing protein [Heliomicrobium gestii]